MWCDVQPTEVVAMLADRSLLRGTDVFAARPRAFVQRVLRDLKAVYEHCDDLTGRLAIIRYLRRVWDWHQGRKTHTTHSLSKYIISELS